MKTTLLGLNEFIKAYTAAIYFTDTGDDGQPPSDAILSSDSCQTIINDCKQFIIAASFYLKCAGEEYGYTTEQAGHDFWLTRNGHGCGFWDRGLGELGDALTAAAKESGQCESYQGDDGLLHLTSNVSVRT